VFPNAFSYPYSPNWQDHSTTAECEFIEEQVGGPEELAKITGSKAHHVQTPSFFNPDF
jgi:xylulokinase